MVHRYGMLIDRAETANMRIFASHGPQVLAASIEGMG